MTEQPNWFEFILKLQFEIGGNWTKVSELVEKMLKMTGVGGFNWSDGAKRLDYPGAEQTDLPGISRCP